MFDPVQLAHFSSQFLHLVLLFSNKTITYFSFFSTVITMLAIPCPPTRFINLSLLCPPLDTATLLQRILPLIMVDGTKVGDGIMVPPGGDTQDTGLLQDMAIDTNITTFQVMAETSIHLFFHLFFVFMRKCLCMLFCASSCLVFCFL